MKIIKLKDSYKFITYNRIFNCDTLKDLIIITSKFININEIELGLIEALRENNNVIHFGDINRIFLFTTKIGEN